MDNRHRQSFFSHSEGLRSIQNLFCFFFFLPSSICLPTFFEIFPELKLLYCEFSSIPSFASLRFVLLKFVGKISKNQKIGNFVVFLIFFAFSTKIVFEHSLKNSKNSRERSNFSLKNGKSGTNASLDKNKPQNSLSERMSWPYRLTLSPCTRISYQFYFLRWLSYLLPGLASSLGVFPIC